MTILLIFPFIAFIAAIVSSVVLFRDTSAPLRHNESQVKNSCKEYGYGCIKVFKTEFNKVEWERNSRFPESLFSKDYFNTISKSKIHASIIEFNGKGMILKGRDKRIAEKIIKAKLKELPLPQDNNNSVDWGCSK